MTAASTSSQQQQQQQQQQQKQQQTQQQQSSTDSATRLPNTTICVPIAYGSIACHLKKPDSNNNTHQWTLYLRGPNNEDLSAGIAKVVFQLHPSFPQPIREITAPPFEVTEKGWGEFEATIRIVWRDVGEKALVLTHMIKLYPPLVPNAVLPPDNSKEPEPVVSEKYDEVVFTDPTETFHSQLMQSGELPKVRSQEKSVQELFQPYSDESDFQKLIEAQKFLEAELKMVKDRILRADASRFELDQALAEVSKKNSTPPPPSSMAPTPSKPTSVPTTANSKAPSNNTAGTKRKSTGKGGSSNKRQK